MSSASNRVAAEKVRAVGGGLRRRRRYWWGGRAHGTAKMTVLDAEFEEVMKAIVRG